MRLNDQKFGPVTLTDINYAPAHSRESLAFTATVQYGAYVGQVRNLGRGITTHFTNSALRANLNAYAFKLPGIQVGGGRVVRQTADHVLESMVEEAIKEYAMATHPYSQRQDAITLTGR